MQIRNLITRILLVSLFLCGPSLLAAQEYELMSNMGTLYGHAIDCGESMEALAPYIPYLIYLTGAPTQAKSKAEFDQIYRDSMSAFQAALRAAMDGPPVSNCDAIFSTLDKMKQATHNFYNKLTPAMREKMNLSPLPPVN